MDFINLQSLEAKKIADWSAKMNRIEEVSRKKDEMELDFMNQAKEKIKAKMGQHEDNREAIMSDIKGKLKVHQLNYMNTIYSCLI